MSTPESAPKIPNFQEKIDAITSRNVSPENINSYAYAALNDLVAIIQDAAAQYDLYPTVKQERGMDQERAAFAYFGLDENGIEATLDHIADRAEEVRNLDSVIEDITIPVIGVITPPYAMEPVPTPGVRHIVPLQRIPRLKTLLFAAYNTFDIDIRNPDECRVMEGEVERGIRRKASYKLVVLPTLNRAVLVCDEEENRTFIFDIEKLVEAGVSEDDLLDASKEDLRAFLEIRPEAGRRLRYSNRFTENVVSLLRTIPAAGEDVVLDLESGQFLQGKRRAPAGYYSTNDVAKELDIPRDLVGQAIAAVAEALGEVLPYRFSNGSTGPILTEGQKATIRSWAETNGYVVQEATPDDASLNKMSKEVFRVANATLNQAIAAIGDGLGSPTRKRVGTNYAKVYSAAQQALIRQWLIANKKIAENPGVRLFSADDLAPRTGLSGVTLRGILGAHATRLALETVNTYTYVPEPEVPKLLTLLRELGYTVPEPPEA